MIEYVKLPITKAQLCQLIDVEDWPFLDKVDRLMRHDLSEGKWKKLYALLAQARHKLGASYVFIYMSPNGYDYDTSCHMRYLRLNRDTTV